MLNLHSPIIHWPECVMPRSIKSSKSFAECSKLIYNFQNWNCNSFDFNHSLHKPSNYNVNLHFFQFLFSIVSDFLYWNVAWKTQHSGFDDKPEGKYELKFKSPSTVLYGPYTIKGKILILPIQGTGISNITVCTSLFIANYIYAKVTRKNYAVKVVT